MSGSAEAARQLRDASDALMPSIRTALDYLRQVRTPAHPTDVVDAMLRTAATVLAMEALHTASDPTQLRDVLALVMEQTGCTRLDTETHTVSLADAPRRAMVTDATALPPGMMAEPKPDLKLIAAALKHGPVAGAELTNGGASTVRFTARKKAAA